MANINQVQETIKQISPPDFQKLVEAYLQASSGGGIHSIGSVSGESKTKTGTPDILVALPGGEYWFAECTTQKEGVVSKFIADLKKCLKEEKTGISRERIKKVLFFANFDLNSHQIEALSRSVLENGIEVEVQGLQSLSYELYDKYPHILFDELNLTFDTGQILPLDRFVEEYGRNKLATPLDTNLIARDKELTEILEALENQDVVILTGAAGNGKTRLAVEAVRMFSKLNPNYKPYVLFNKGPEIFDDLKSYFSPPGQYLLFVDDANRISGFPYVVGILINQKENQSFKLIVTVRDYAKDQIDQTIATYGNTKSIIVNPLDDTQIRSVVEGFLPDKNMFFYNRIITVAHGNPRIAIMICRQLQEGTDPELLNDVSSVYDQYFSSILKDEISLGEPANLKVAGIVALLRVIDRDNAPLLNDILKSGNLDEEEFWSRVALLADLEIFDLHEKRVVKVSDQVLATYLAYQNFFIKKSLDLGKIFHDLFPQYANRLIDTIAPLLNTFYREDIWNQLSKIISVAFDKYKERSENQNLHKLMVQYGTLIPSKTLGYLNELIIESPVPVSIPSNQTWEPAVNLSENSVLGILANFRGVVGSEETALELLCAYFQRNPSEAPQILKLLTTSWGFNSRTHFEGTTFQLKVLEIFSNHLSKNHESLFHGLLFGLRKHYLTCQVQSHEEGSKNSITIHQFRMMATEGVKELRKRYLEQVRSSCPVQDPSLMVKLIEEYPENTLYEYNKDLVEWDSHTILSWLDDPVASINVEKSFGINRYLEYLQALNIPVPENLLNRYATLQETLYRLIVPHTWGYLMDSWDEEAERINTIDKLCNYLNQIFSKSLMQTFQTLSKVWPKVSTVRNNYYSPIVLTEAFKLFSQNYPNKLLPLVESFVLSGTTSLIPWVPVPQLISIAGVETTLNFLQNHTFPGKDSWLLNLFQEIPCLEQKSEHLPLILTLFSEGQFEGYPRSSRFLVDYSKFHKELIPEVVKILIGRQDTEGSKLLTFSVLGGSQIDNLSNWFSSCPELLEQAYMIADENDPHFDLMGELFSQLIDRSPGFVERYILSILLRENREKYRETSHRDFSVIWNRTDLTQTLVSILLQLARSSEENYLSPHETLELIFQFRENRKLPVSHLQLQDLVLKSTIEELMNEEYPLVWIYELISEFDPERRFGFIRLLVDKLVPFSTFERIHLVPLGMSWSGSAVPEYQRRIDYLVSLLPLFKGIKLLEHKQHLEAKISIERDRLSRAKKEDFTSDF